MSNKTQVKYKAKKAIFYVILAIALLWGIGAWGLMLHFRHGKGFEEVTYKQMILLPFNIDAHRKELGIYYIREGFKKIDEGEFQEGFDWVRMGLIRNPENFEARRYIAEAYIHGLRRVEEGVDILLKGREWIEDSSDQLGYLFRLLMALGRNEQILELAQSFRDESVQELCKWAIVQTYVNTGQIEAAKDMLYGDEVLKSSIQGRIIDALIDKEKNNIKSAQDKLKELVKEQPGNVVVLQELVRFYIDQNELDLAYEYAKERLKLDKANINAYLDLVEIAYSRKDCDSSSELTRAIIDIFSKHNLGLKQLASLAAEHGDVATINKLYELALNEGQEPVYYVLKLIELHYRDGQLNKGLSLINEAENEMGQWLVKSRSEFLAIKGLVELSLGKNEEGVENVERSVKGYESGVSDLKGYINYFMQGAWWKEAQLMLLKIVENEEHDSNVINQLLETQVELKDVTGVISSINIAKNKGYRLSTDLSKNLQGMLSQDVAIHEEKAIESLAWLERS